MAASFILNQTKHKVTFFPSNFRLPLILLMLSPRLLEKPHRRLNSCSFFDTLVTLEKYYFVFFFFIFLLPRLVSQTHRPMDLFAGADSVPDAL
jgi:hypothetical protein